MSCHLAAFDSSHAFPQAEVMNISLYQEFKAAANLHKRDEAAEKVHQFIASSEGDEETTLWVRQFLESGDYGHKIRHELYRDLVFPVLLRGYSKRDPWSLYYLAQTVQNIYSDKKLHEFIEWHTEFSLLKLCYGVDTCFRDVRERLLATLVKRLGFYIHEWPSGLCGELKDVEDDLDFARSLDVDGKLESDFYEVDEVLLEDKQRYASLPCVIVKPSNVL